MSFRVRLWAAFGAVAVLLLVPVWYADVRLAELREMAVERREEHAAATAALGDFRTGLANFDRQLRAYVATLDAEMAPVLRESVRELRQPVDRLESAGYGVAEPLAGALDSLAALTDRVVTRVEAGSVEEATRTFREVARLQPEISARVSDVTAVVDASAQRDFALAEEMSATAATTTVIATLAALLLALGVTLWTTRTLTAPLRRLSEAAARVEAGTFEAPEDLPYERSDEIGDLSRSFRAMTERLGELDRMKAEFMSVASHELKTPISVIRAYTELFELQLGDELTEEQRRHLETILEQTDVMVRLVGRLLNIGRLETGGYALEVTPVGVRELMDQLARSFHVLAREQGVDLRTEVRDTAPDTVHVDVDLLRNEVLGNLVSNAVRYTPEDGEIRIRVWGEDGAVVFEVSDTGPGVPEEKRPYIFEKYYEGDRTEALGAGLGLAVAKEVVEAHGGRITLESSDEDGATFRVYLPISSRSAEPA